MLVLLAASRSREFCAGARIYVPPWSWVALRHERDPWMPASRSARAKAMKRRVCRLKIPIYYTPEGKRTCASNIKPSLDCPLDMTVAQ